MNKLNTLGLRKDTAIEGGGVHMGTLELLTQKVK